MIAGCIDPGAKYVGWCLLDFRRHRPSFLDGGTVAPNEIEQVELAFEPHRPEIVVIEKPVGRVIEGRNATSLLECAINMGDARRFFRNLGYEVIEVSRAEWVTALLGAFARGKQDPQVKRAVSMLVQGWPRGSEHMADAAGAGICGERIWRQKRRTG